MSLVPGFHYVILKFHDEPEQLETFIGLVSSMRIIINYSRFYLLLSSADGQMRLDMKTQAVSSTMDLSTYPSILT